MRILIISHMYPNTSNRVAGNFVHEQVKELITNGHDVTVISPTPYTPLPFRFLKKRWKKIAEIPKKEIYEGVEIYFPRYVLFPKLIFENLSGIFMYLGIKSTVKKVSFNRPFNLIHAHVILPDGHAATKISKNSNTPLVVTVHGKDFASTIHNEKSYKVIKKTLDSTDGIILVSKKLESIMSKFFPNINHDKTEIIYNGINDIFFNKKELKKTRNEEFVILSVSNLIKTKGIDLNIYAVHELLRQGKNIKYNIIGDGIEKGALMDLTKELGIENSINFLGIKKPKEVRDYLNSCDVFSLPSWSEAFGIVYLEAMAMGKPIIGCREQGIEEIIDHNINGYLIDPKNQDDLTSILKYIIENQRKDVGAAAEKLVVNTFSWKENINKTEDFYKAVIKK